MRLIESLMTKNPCYKRNLQRDDSRYKTFQDRGPLGLMLHSVGCPQPDAQSFIRTWNLETYTKACVHAFIDGNDGTVYQTLPWNYRGWHGGGECNNTHIGVEMCEPSVIKYTRGSLFLCSDAAAAQESAKRTYTAAVELFAMLCDRYSLDPLEDGVILSHCEGHGRGIASNHGDPEHLWSQLGLPYTMDGFREAVKQKMTENRIDNTPAAWSKEAVAWAVGNKLILGDEHGDLMLRSPITREQLCVMLKRYHDAVGAV